MPNRITGLLLPGMDAAPHSREEHSQPDANRRYSVLPAGNLTRTERQPMNKLTKGAVAAAAAIALLLGGAGTFATWNASSAVADAGITAGTLSIASGAVAGTWSDATGTSTCPATGSRPAMC